MNRVATSIRATGHPLSGSLFSELQSDILRGRLKQGEKLSEQQICDKYGLSRTPVREAFRQLELKVTIETMTSRGELDVAHYV